MKHSTKAMVALLAIPALSVGASAVAAHAETGSASSIVDASLSSLGVSISDPTLLAELETQVQAAIDTGVVDPTVDPLVDPVVEPTVEPTSEPTTDPTVEPTSEPTSEPTVEPTEPGHGDNGLHLGHLHDQFQLWDMASPVWNAAFETIRVDFETCVAAADPAVDCSAQTLTALQLAHADVLSSSYDALAAEISALPAEEQPFAQAYLDRQLEHAQRRLAHALEEYATNPDGTPVELTPEILAEINDEIDRINGHSQGNGHISGHGNGRDDSDEEDSDFDSDETSDGITPGVSDPTNSTTPSTSDSVDTEDSQGDDESESSSGTGGRHGGNSGNSGNHGSHGDD